MKMRVMRASSPQRRERRQSQPFPTADHRTIGPSDIPSHSIGSCRNCCLIADIGVLLRENGASPGERHSGTANIRLEIYININININYQTLLLYEPKLSIINININAIINTDII
jgi:hypothetical protein